MKRIIPFITMVLLFSCTAKQPGKTLESRNSKTEISKKQLLDKIKGGWAGQVIGCTFGGPTEFKFNGTMINDYQPIPWNENSCLWYYQNEPGLYDDVYMDLTFVDVFEKEGIEAPAESHAKAYAHAEYMLWHANQAGRYNILNGIQPPMSGHWLNNPHADDIDFQIEADFAGLMSPGMVNVATGICDKIGHIMNYGDGWYGGVYVASMYSLAFVSSDIEFIVNEALKTIPRETDFYRCIADVISWHNKYPGDWQQTWFEVQRKWSSEVGCPDGVFSNFNIDAKVNAAYVVIGLLYGNGNFSKTMEISARCGQDSDCNPATAGGILGTILGYSAIPDFWKSPVLKVENLDFKYTTMSLDDVYDFGFKQAVEVLKKNGAATDGETISIPLLPIQPVRTEISFEGHYPVEKRNINLKLNDSNRELEVEFRGKGYVLTGNAGITGPEIKDEDIQVEIAVDGLAAEVATMPVSFSRRRHEIAWKYQLPEGVHRVKIRMLNPGKNNFVNVKSLIVYSGIKTENAWKK